jgi:hypothetical protein
MTAKQRTTNTRTYWISLYSMAQAEVAVVSDGEKQQWQAAGTSACTATHVISIALAAPHAEVAVHVIARSRLSRHNMQQWPVGLSGLQLTLFLPLLLFNHATVASGTEWAAAHVFPATLAVQSCNSGQWD